MYPDPWPIAGWASLHQLGIRIADQRPHRHTSWDNVVCERISEESPVRLTFLNSVYTVEYEPNHPRCSR